MQTERETIYNRRVIDRIPPTELQLQLPTSPRTALRTSKGGLAAAAAADLPTSAEQSSSAVAQAPSSSRSHDQGNHDAEQQQALNPSSRDRRRGSFLVKVRQPNCTSARRRAEGRSSVAGAGASSHTIIQQHASQPAAVAGGELLISDSSDKLQLYRTRTRNVTFPSYLPDLPTHLLCCAAAHCGELSAASP